MSKSETQTRSELINMQLARSGWFGSRYSIIEEAPLSVAEEQLPYGYEPKNKKTERLGFADYLLLGTDGKPLAVVEAKRTSRDPLAGKRQAEDYAESVIIEYGQPVHSNGSFDDWFHPYHRHTNGSLNLDYVLPDMKVECKANQPVNQPKVANLDYLLNLSSRWTREFKAEYAKHQRILNQREERRIRNGQNRHTQAEVQNYLQDWKNDLISTEPHHEVHSLLSDALLEPSRLSAWSTELSLL